MFSSSSFARSSTVFSNIARVELAAAAAPSLEACASFAARRASRKSETSFELSSRSADLSTDNLAARDSEAATAAADSSALRFAWRSAPMSSTFTERSFLFSSCASATISAPAARVSPSAAATSVSVALTAAASSEESSSLRRLSCAFSAFARATNSAAPRASRSLAALCASAAELASPATFLESRSESMNLALSSRRRAFCSFAASS